MNQHRVACNLVTNFEVALIKKLSQCSVFSHWCFLPHCPLSYCCTIFVNQDAWTPTDGQSLGRHSRLVNSLGISLRVAVPSLAPKLKRRWGRVRLHVGYLRIPAIFQLVCHAFLSITFAFSGYLRSVEARRLTLRSKRNRNPSRSNRKNRKSHRISNPKTRRCFSRKLKTKCWIPKNPQTEMNTKTEVLWHKNRKTDPKNSQNHKIENPNAPSLGSVYDCDDHSYSRLYPQFRYVTFI